MSIYSSLSKFHKEVGTIKKSSNNPHFKSKYADINVVLDAIREPLEKAGLCFVQLPMQGGLKTILATVEGDEQIESFLEYELSKKDMQGLGSAITYARRYALVCMLGLEAEDDDGNESVKVPPKVEEAPYNVLNVLNPEQKRAIENLIQETGVDREKVLVTANSRKWDYETIFNELQKKLQKAS